MIYGLLILLAVLAAYITLLHLKLREVQELLQESNILTSSENTGLKQTYYIKFNVDRDFKITHVNGDTLVYGKFERENLIGASVFGTLLSDTPENHEMIDELWKQLKKRRHIISSQQVLQTAEGVKIPVLLRARPLLNELLNCKGISFWSYPLNQQLKLEKQLKSEQEKDTVIGAVLNAESFYAHLDNRVKIDNRYNRPLLLVVVELADIYGFVNKGFSFDTGDRLLRAVAEACIENTPHHVAIGRFDHTKIGIVAENFADDLIEQQAQILWDNVIASIRKLNVDKVNAGMVSIFYTRRKFNDDMQNMLSRSRKYLKNSLKIHRYGIRTLDKVK